VETLALLASLVGVVLLISYIWLAVVAFRRRILWGVLVLLFSPITAIIFAIKYWVEARQPFLVYMVSSTLIFAYFGYMFVHMGGPEMLEMADRMEQGEFTEAEAFDFMQNTMDRMETSGLLDAQEQQDLAQMQTVLDEIKGDFEPAREDSGNPVEAAPVLLRPIKNRPYPYQRPSMTFQDVPLSKLTALINAPIRVFDRQGREHNVTLLGMENGDLKLRKNIAGGTFDFGLPSDNVQRIQALEPESS
jgi:hypothetical protein